jgi:hypothetical protein
MKGKGEDDIRKEVIVATGASEKRICLHPKCQRKLKTEYTKY